MRTVASTTTTSAFTNRWCLSASTSSRRGSRRVRASKRVDEEDDDAQALEQLLKLDDVIAARTAAHAAVTTAMRAKKTNTIATVKSDSSVATTADLAAQIVCRKMLESTTPYGFVGEETHVEALEDAGTLEAVLEACGAVMDINASDAVEALRDGVEDSREYWVCDPLDGTKAFVSDEKTKQFVFGLALVEDAGPRVAVMMAPNWYNGGGIELFAVRGHGCFSRAFGEDAFRVSCASPRPERLTDARVVVSAHEDFERLPLGRAGVKPAAVSKLCCGSLCKYIAVCVGDADVFIQHPKKDDLFVNSWDHAAGVLCAREAGAVVTDTNGERLSVTGPDGDRRLMLPGGGGVIVASKAIHEDVVRAYALGLEGIDL
jgi:3'(2'), 5'-bisphosphate nucleotidase